MVFTKPVTYLHNKLFLLTLCYSVITIGNILMDTTQMCNVTQKHTHTHTQICTIHAHIPQRWWTWWICPICENHPATASSVPRWRMPISHACPHSISVPGYSVHRNNSNNTVSHTCIALTAENWQFITNPPKLYPSTILDTRGSNPSQFSTAKVLRHTVCGRCTKVMGAHASLSGGTVAWRRKLGNPHTSGLIC